MRLALALAAGGLAIAASPAHTDGSVDMYAAVRPSIIGPAPVHMQRSNARGDLIEIVDRAADGVGVPREEMRFVVTRESGWRPDAQNSRSTATGLTQVVKGSHEAIIGRRLTLSEHRRLMKDPDHAARVGAAHWRMCRDLVGHHVPASKVWRACFYSGPANVGGRIEMAAAHFRPDSSGWLQRGSIAWLSGGGA